MKKLVVLKLGAGDFLEQGFPVTVQVRHAGQVVDEDAEEMAKTTPYKLSPIYLQYQSCPTATIAGIDLIAKSYSLTSTYFLMSHHISLTNC